MKKHRRWLLLFPATALAAVAVACGGSDDNGGASSGGGTSSGGGDVPTATQGGGEVAEIGEPSRQIEVSMLDNVFEPVELRMAVGEAVEIVAINDGLAIHNLHVLSAETEGQDFASDPIVNPGDSSAFTVQFSTPGTYKFQCDFHLPGMVGEIIVE